ncbi:2-dehydro-3-deoxyphosphogluconate aldolase [Halovivax asiaticus JCM 14624]|uniref:2-dehydro-3-deoxyphosphogluconate aldolase n=1 Tax=Halovivax asiaticus JCM 14624 TaxID=1227490 RepID=M0B8L9_9EURY|nr:bifunctional 4-hydroxy-2-oxoglutarate aldolase/2-dehydro-3-deoxy-phosphogluconate aldolase [Halovivax asiaticus]ELZ07150.1 2-dehydro-3-deoxyphosphogluconate aldolase [Halovivax asiaticus JCM 14624]
MSFLPTSDRVGDKPLATIVDSGVVAVLRGVDRESVAPVAKALVAGGVLGIEITADDPGAAEKVSRLRAELAETDAVIGAGTVLDAATASAVVDAGASFVVTPHTAPEVVRTCNRRDVLSMCGVLTPTEAVTAIEAGADVLKVFPASSVGPGHLSALAGPLGDVNLIPTGGVTLQNTAAYIDAGACAIGVGGDLVDGDAIESGDFDMLERRAEKFVDEVADARGK